LAYPKRRKYGEKKYSYWLLFFLHSIFRVTEMNLLGFRLRTSPAGLLKRLVPPPQSVSVLPDRSWGRLAHPLAEKETTVDA